MSYYPHKSRPGWWTIDYRISDPDTGETKRIREHIKGTEDDASQYEREQRQLHVSSFRTSSSPMFKVIAGEFQSWAITNRSENYCKSIKWALKNLLPHFGVFPPSRITDSLCEQYKRQRKGSPVACNYELKMLVVICNWGANPKRGYCKALPFTPEYIHVFKKLPEPPAPDEFEQLLDQVAINFKQARATPEEQIHKLAMILIMYETGIRWIECRHLQWENLRDDGRLYLGRTKTNKARYTILSKEVMELLGKLKKTEGYIFINPRTDELYKSIGKGLRHAGKQAGVKMTGTHSLRHALGTDMQNANGDIRGTQELLGHADIKTTTIYTHTATERIRGLLGDVAEYRKSKRHLSLVHSGQEKAA